MCDKNLPKYKTYFLEQIMKNMDCDTETISWITARSLDA